MADHTIAQSELAAHEITLTAGTIEAFVFEGDVTAVEVFSHDGAAIVYATIDGSTPVVRGAKSLAIPAAQGGTIFAPPGYRGRFVVKLISEGTPKMTVSRADRS